MLIRQKIIRWVIFSVIVALLPIIFNGLVLLTKGNLFEIETLTGRGELLLIAAAMAASAIGELIASGKTMASIKLIAGGCCLIVLSMASLYFAHVSYALMAKEFVDYLIVSKISINLYVASIVSSSCCIILADV